MAAAYNSSLIPDYEDLRSAVLRRHAKLYPNQQKSPLPIMAIMAMTQDGAGTSTEDVTCYSCCGEKGHYAGDQKCTKPGSIAPSVPNWYRSGRSAKGKGKGGNETQRAEAKAKARALARAKARAKATTNPMVQARSPVGTTTPMAPVVQETIANSHTMVHAAETKSL
jgi:hypothetical protein